MQGFLADWQRGQRWMAPFVEWLQIFPAMVFNSIQKHSLRALERREALRSLTAEDMKKCV
jgi:hypothetical protein